MRRTMLVATTATLTAMAITLAPGALADRDTDFATELHGYGIYGQRDYNAWLAKITCKRLSAGLDADPKESAAFLVGNLAGSTSTEQAWQFMGTAVRIYCPEHTAKLTAMAGDSDG